MPDDVIEAAVDEIESDGLTDWAPVASAEDYDQYEDNEPDDLEVSAIARDLEDLIQGLPEAVAEPAVEVGGDGLIHMAIPPTRTQWNECAYGSSECRAALSRYHQR